MDKVRLRDDLAEEELGIPAYDAVEKFDIGIGLTYLFKNDLQEAQLINEIDDETKPEYNFEYIKLKDGRQFYVHGVDLDYERG